MTVQRDAAPLVHLHDPAAADPAVGGRKAATLAALGAAGHPVPPGVVVPIEVVARLDIDLAQRLAHEVVAALGPGPLAVRSSALAEDRADASYAGLYESVLDVHGTAALANALEHVRASASNARVDAYEHGRHHDEGIAVLVQRQVDARAAGVAFTADPVTGDREAVVVTAVAGLGERLVSGQDDGEEWVIRGNQATPHHGGASVLDAAAALAVADLARAVAAGAGEPQDVEWATDGTTTWLLQARPMTALADPVTWDPPAAGWWRRDFRFGEWLPEPVTPLFETWWFPRQEAGFRSCTKEEWDISMRGPFHVLVNGWCYCSLGQMGPAALLGVVRHPIRMARWIAALATVGKNPALGERAMALPAKAAYDQDLLPRYQLTVADAAGRVEAAGPGELASLVDRLAEQVGWLTYPLVETLGYAGKAEFALAALVHEHLSGAIDGHLPLLAGLRKPQPPHAHAVSSLDWHRPTLGELGLAATAPDAARHAELVARREAAEVAARTALAHQPKLLARFDEFLDIAQRYAVVREEMAAELTLAWPTMRRALDRLGHHLVSSGAIDRPEDIHFLEHAEVLAALDARPADLRGEVAARRARWERQRLLTPPVSVGTESPVHKRIAMATETLRSSPLVASEDCVVGIPASAGRATGTVRVVRSLEDFGRVRDGDVLVAPVTAPAWTPLFAHVVAVVTDSGSAAAHASVIAREYGIPAVVGTHDATARLADGDMVIVDGGRGTVEVVGTGSS